MFSHAFVLIAQGQLSRDLPTSYQLDVNTGRRGLGSTLQGVKDDLEVAEDPATPSKKLSDLFEKTTSKKVKLAILRNPNTSTEFLQERSMFTEKDEIEAILENPARIIGRVTFDPEWSAIEGFIATDIDDLNVLRELAMHHDPDVRKIVAMRSITPEDVQIALAQDPSEEVQYGLTFLDESIIHESAQLALAKSKFERVIVEMAGFVQRPAVLQALIDTDDSEVLTILNGRKHLPSHIRQQVADALLSKMEKMR